MTISLVSKGILEFPPKNAPAPFSKKITTVSPGPRGTQWALGVRRIKKLHKRENDQRPILAGVPFIKNVEIPKLNTFFQNNQENVCGITFKQIYPSRVK